MLINACPSSDSTVHFNNITNPQIERQVRNHNCVFFYGSCNVVCKASKPIHQRLAIQETFANLKTVDDMNNLYSIGALTRLKNRTKNFRNKIYARMTQHISMAVDNSIVN